MTVTRVHAAAAHKPARSGSSANATKAVQAMEKFISHQLGHADTGIDQWELTGAQRNQLPPAAKKALAEYQKTATSNGGDAMAYRFNAKDVLGKGSEVFFGVREADTDGANNDNFVLFDAKGNQLATAD